MADETQTEGAWIFVSHSHRDLDSVRKLRDALEAKGHNPLLFFLKCLGDDAEIDDLIRREIDARRFFLLCESPNAKASRWVQAELEIIKGLENKVYVTVDMLSDWESQLAAIDEMARRATVFISYAREDASEIAARITTELRKHDYNVLLDLEALPAGVEFQTSVQALINQAIANGLVLVLLSPGAVENPQVSAELQYALKRCAEEGATSRVIPVLVKESPEMYDRIKSTPGWVDVERFNWIILRDDAETFAGGIDMILSLLRKRAMAPATEGAQSGTGPPHPPRSRWWRGR